MEKKDFYFHTEKLSVGYDGNRVVSDVTVHVKRGQILTLIGPNGAGKTTILKSIIGQLLPMAGVAVLDNVLLSDMDARELSRKMAVVLTNRIQTEMMTVEDVVATGRYPYTGLFGILSDEDHAIVENAMKMIHVSEIREQDFLKISDGQRQRVMLARALAQQPDIVVLDEPTSFLDMKYKLEFLSILQRLAKENKLTVILSLHEVELARKISDQIACFKNGKLDRYGTPEEVFKGNYLLELFDIQTEELSPVFQDMFFE